MAGVFKVQNCEDEAEHGGSNPKQTQWAHPSTSPDVVPKWGGNSTFAAMFKHFIFTHSDSRALFLGERKITVDVAPPPPTQWRSLPIQLLVGAILVEVAKTDTRFCPYFGKRNFLGTAGSLWKVRSLNLDIIEHELLLKSTHTAPHGVATKPGSGDPWENIRVADCGHPLESPGPYSPACGANCKNIDKAGSSWVESDFVNLPAGTWWGKW